MATNLWTAQSTFQGSLIVAGLENNQLISMGNVGRKQRVVQAEFSDVQPESECRVGKSESNVLSGGGRAPIESRLKEDEAGGLHAACRNGQLEVVRALVERGESVDRPDEKGDTPLVLAAWRGFTGIVELLLEHGASIDLADDGGCSSLMKASFYGHNEVVKLLVQRGASVDIQDTN